MNAPAGWLPGAAGWVVERPWLAAVAAVAVAAAVAARNHEAARRHRRFAAGARLVTIAPPPQVDPKSAAVLWANLHGLLTPSRWQRLRHGTPHLVWQYAWTGRRLLISVWVPGTVPPGAVEAAVRAAWPAAACITEPATGPLPGGVAAITAGALSLTLPEWLPLHTDHDLDPLRPLVSAGAQLRDHEHAVVQILARPATARRARRARRAATRLRDGKTATPMLNPAAPLHALLDALLPGPASRNNRTPTRRDPHLERDVRAILDKTSHPMWQAGIRYAVATTSSRAGADPHRRLRGIADAAASSFAVYAGRNRLARRTTISRPEAALSARR